MLKHFKILLAALGLAAFTQASAQQVYQDCNNPDILRPDQPTVLTRNEIIVPGIMGYNVYKADLHMHSTYSDGMGTPSHRALEAWLDGLDVFAIADHLEYRQFEEHMISHLTGYVKEGAEAINCYIYIDPADERGIQVDLNSSVRRCVEEGVKYGLTVIPGIEITREDKTIGHYAALFTTDNNKIYDPDPAVALRNAKAQGAIIQHNHPGRKKSSMEQPEWERMVYEEGLISGIEVMNGEEFYPKAIDRAGKWGLYMAANSDLHRSTAIDYQRSGFKRNMTLIFAEDKSLESLKEALLADRTLAYSFGNVAGEVSILKEFFLASVAKGVVAGNVTLTNNSSIAYVLKINGEGNLVWLQPLSTIVLPGVKVDDVVKVEVTNMWCGDMLHPEIEL